MNREIEKILAELLEQVEAEGVFFCDRGGNIIAQRSVNKYEHTENIAALAAGSFFATLEMARLVGEPKFRSLLHQGESSSIYMEGMKGDLLLVVIFSKDSNAGLVKLYAKNTCQQLQQYKVQLAPGERPSSQILPKLELVIDETAQPFTNSVKVEPT